MRSFEASLERLGRDRIDVALVHDIGSLTHGADAHPQLFRQLIEGGLRALGRLRAEGAVRAIGLGVNENEVCMDALGIGSWDVFLLAGRYTLLEQTPMTELFPACRAAGTSIICGGPFNSGVLVGRKMWNYATAPAEVLDKVRKIGAIADKHGVRLPAAALQLPTFFPHWGV